MSTTTAQHRGRRQRRRRRRAGLRVCAPGRCKPTLTEYAFLVIRMRGGWNHQGEGLNSDRPGVVSGDRNSGDGVASATGGFLESSTLVLREYDR